MRSCLLVEGGFVASDWDPSIKRIEPGIRLILQILSTQFTQVCCSRSRFLWLSSLRCMLASSCALSCNLAPELSSVSATGVCRMYCQSRACCRLSFRSRGTLSCNCSSRTSCVQMLRSLNAVQLCPPDFGVSCTSMFSVGALLSRA